jgi:hypothetical protein
MKYVFAFHKSLICIPKAIQMNTFSYYLGSLDEIYEIHWEKSANLLLSLVFTDI